ncbi:T9SS type A sorting domain-containing protein [Flavobacterium sp.]|uniref:T9SS type A sorting domain-containing protein n=1 Tax=Flavobacterium sp. TaxID=239 RepID=UPI0024874BB8|nr:T9SS type A sorting domain-containing protein [Flavobacterium sp.]MDI1315914.1 T9SS type A sorting domain-containing protein [Flavobacterium sp.]
MKKTVINSLSAVILGLFSVVSFAQTAGTFTITYNQPQPTSPAGVKNVYAVWIENAAGTFIKTKARYVSTSTDDHLPSWGAKAGCTNAVAVASSGNNCSVTDALTGATRTATTTPTAYGAKSVTWDGKNVVGTTNGTTVADGIYKIWIESSWVDSGSNNHQVVTSFSFTKGPTVQHLTPTSPSTYFNTVVLDWIPTALGINDVVNSEPAVVIYPVPSSGIFNIDLKNEVKDIKVYNLLGQTVYSQQFDSNNATTTKQIDLSNLSNGNYIFSLTNENGTSNYEVILRK